MPTYKANVTNKAQDQLEEAQFDGGAAVFEDAKTRIVAKGAQTAAQKTSNAGSSIRNNAGVIMPHDDNPGRFLGDTQGKS